MVNCINKLERIGMTFESFVQLGYGRGRHAVTQFERVVEVKTAIDAKKKKKKM